MKPTLYILTALFCSATVLHGQNSGAVQTLLESKFPILDPSFTQAPFYGQNQMVYVVTDSASSSIYIRGVNKDSLTWNAPSLVYSSETPKRHPVGAFTTQGLQVVFWEESGEGVSKIEYSLFQDSVWSTSKDVLTSTHSQSEPFVGQELYGFGPIYLGWIEDDSLVTASWSTDSMYAVQRWKKIPTAHIVYPVVSADYSVGFYAWEEDTDSTQVIQFKTMGDTSAIKTLIYAGYHNTHPGLIRGANTLTWSTASLQTTNIVAGAYTPWFPPPNDFSSGPLTNEIQGECLAGGGQLFPVTTFVSRLQKKADFTHYHFFSWRWRFEDSSAIVLFYPPLYPPNRKEIWSKDSLTLPIVSLPMLKRDTMSFWTVWVESNSEAWRLNGTITSFFYMDGGVEPYHPKEMVLLSQNYPNPFNPSTTIRFSIPTRSRVRLTVINLLGQQVVELANEEMNAGSYERTWNANVASGLYFYRIEAVSVNVPAKKFVDVKKMILLR